jgi:O-antigen ligase
MRIAIASHHITITRMMHVMLVAGSFVAGIGILQYIGIDLAPWLGQKRAFSDNVVATGNIRRVASVYGHANNLGLFLERLWPWALAAIVVPAWRWRGAWPVAISVAIGLLLSFSRGAWLAAALASGLLVALHVGASTLRRRPWLVPMAMGIGIALVAVALLARGGEGGSIDARLLLWQESITWLQQRPWGLGLGQFYFFHNPEFGHSIMDARLIGTSEQYAAHPHNLVLDIWLNLGPIGLIAIGAIVFAHLRQALRPPLTIRARTLSAITLVAMLAHGSIDQFFFVSDLVYCFWLMILVIQVDTDQATPL